MEMKVKQTIEETRVRRSRRTRKRGGGGLPLQLITNGDRGPFSVSCEMAVTRIVRTR
jgi:hypothetical protein